MFHLRQRSAGIVVGNVRVVGRSSSVGVGVGVGAGAGPRRDLAHFVVSRAFSSTHNRLK